MTKAILQQRKDESQKNCGTTLLTISSNFCYYAWPTLVTQHFGKRESFENHYVIVICNFNFSHFLLTLVCSSNFFIYYFKHGSLCRSRTNKSKMRNELASPTHTQPNAGTFQLTTTAVTVCDTPERTNLLRIHSRYEKCILFILLHFYWFLLNVYWIWVYCSMYLKNRWLKRNTLNYSPLQKVIVYKMCFSLYLLPTKSKHNAKR